MKRSCFSILSCLAVLATLSCGGAADNKPLNGTANSVNRSGAAHTPLPAATIDELGSGRKVYEANCVICHKDDGTGGEVTIEGRKLNPDDLTSDKIKSFSDEKIIGYVKNGVVDEGMPAFKDKLSEGEMRDVVKFIRVELQKMPASAKSDQLAN